MTIRRKVVLLLAAVSALFAGSSYLTQSVVVMPSFVRLEQNEAEENLGRATEALRRDLDLLSMHAHDWSAWDDLYAYVQGGDPTFVKENCVDETFANNHLALIWLIDADGKMVWGESHGQDFATHIELPDLMARVLRPGGLFLSHQTNESQVKGFVGTAYGAMLIVSRPIVKSNNEGPIRGTLVMGRWLTEESVRELRERTRVSLDIRSVQDKGIPPADRAVLAQLHDESDSVLWNGPDRKLLAYGILRDLYGQPLLLVRAETDRSITAQGAKALQVSGWLSVIGAAIVGGVIWLALRNMVVAPLLKVRDHVMHIGRTNDLRAQMAMGRYDEIGTLADEFDRMVAHLRNARAQMLEVAHRAGMAEIATDVLHNVGNAMNTINVTTGTLEERLKNSKTAGLDKAAQLLASHESDFSGFLANDPRGQKLPGYLIQLSQAVQEERGHLLEELRALQQKVHHVRDIIMAQQDHAVGPSLQVEEDLACLVDATLRMHEREFVEACVIIERQYEPLPPVPVNRVKLTQVLVNLIRNSLEAMQGTRDRQRRLIVRLGRDGEEAVRLEVTDTGIGVEPQTLGRLFQHGFTTRPDGHGLGLPFCANAMKEMGGMIEARSDGLEQGATFTARLPMAGRGAVA